MKYTYENALGMGVSFCRTFNLGVDKYALDARRLACAAIGALVLSFAGPAYAQAPLTKPEDVGMSSSQLALIREAMAVNIASGQIPGAIVMVVRNGKIVYRDAQGVTDLRTKTPLKTDAIFGIASLTKPIVAAAVLMLVDEGKISLNDPLSKYVPEFGAPKQVRVLKPGSPPAAFSAMPGMLPEVSEFGTAQYDMVPASRPITIRDLLTHTSGVEIFGITNPGMPGPTPGDTLATRVPKMASAPLEFQPGSRWAYSRGPAFEILGRVVEVASGKPFNVFLKERLFGPLGMKDTDFGVHRDSVSRALPPPPNGRITTSDQVTYFAGSAGLSSTVEDYSHFAQMLVDHGSYGGKQFLKPETVKAMSSNQIGPLVMGGYPPMGMPPEGLKFGYGVLTLTNPAASGTQLPPGSFGWDGVGGRRLWAVPDQRIALLIWAPVVGPSASPLQRVVEGIVESALIR